MNRCKAQYYESRTSIASDKQPLQMNMTDQENNSVNDMSYIAYIQF